MNKIIGKKFGIVNVLFCLAATFLLLGALTALNPPAEASSAPEIVTTGIPGKSDMDTLTAIFTRRSVRKYADKPVSDATIKLLLQAAMAAPTAKNTQSWEFIVIRDKKTLEQIPSFHPFAKHVPEAPVAIVVCGNTKLEAAKGHWVPDSSNASMNILLAAPALGQGGSMDNLLSVSGQDGGHKKAAATTGAHHAAKHHPAWLPG